MLLIQPEQSSSQNYKSKQMIKIGWKDKARKRIFYTHTHTHIYIYIYIYITQFDGYI